MAFTLIWHGATRRSDTLVGASVSFVADGDIDETKTRALVKGLQVAGVRCNCVIAGDSGQAIQGAALERWLKLAA